MKPEVIDLIRERAKRMDPDPDCVKTDQHGQKMFLFSLHYRFDDRTWSVDLWAYSSADAEARVAAMRENLVVVGQTVAQIPV